MDSGKSPAKISRQDASAVFTAMRPHHWFKNLLLAVPVVMAHCWDNWTTVWQLLVAIGAFSLVASAIYLFNDLIDLSADRLHPVKKKRPIASGALSTSKALTMAILLTATGMALGWILLPGRFVLLMLAYALLALAYSVCFKRCLVLDVLVLAGLYAFRIFAGGAVVNIQVSAWLLAFSGFFFLSLAFAKRYLDLAVEEDENGFVRTGNRPYTIADLEIFRIAGPTCGLLSVLVLALYINGSAVQILYKNPFVLWFLCPLFFYWMLRWWVLVLRRETTSTDPVVFALRDKASVVVLFLVILVLYFAT
jgi:4-hydroxybenzoate polyprenyltransferase